MLLYESNLKRINICSAENTFKYIVIMSSLYCVICVQYAACCLKQFLSAICFMDQNTN